MPGTCPVLSSFQFEFFYSMCWYKILKILNIEGNFLTVFQGYRKRYWTTVLTQSHLFRNLTSHTRIRTIVLTNFVWLLDSYDRWRLYFRPRIELAKYIVSNIPEAIFEHQSGIISLHWNLRVYLSSYFWKWGQEC